MARRLADRMTRAGRSVEAHFFDGEGHIFSAPARNREGRLLVDFFSRHLVTTITYVNALAHGAGF